MKMEMLVPTPKVMAELRKILRVEARFAVMLEQEVKAKELALERTKDLVSTARQLADMKRSEAWLHWRTHIEEDDKAEQLNQMRKKNAVNSPGSRFGGN